MHNAQKTSNFLVFYLVSKGKTIGTHYLCIKYDMKKLLLSLLLVLGISGIKAQSYQALDTIKAPANLDNIYNRLLYSDSLTSSFVIFIKKEVKEHKHATHAEHVVVLEGEAVMKVDGQSFKIKKGSMVFIPKDTWHYVKVTSKVPLKVVSIQAPNFDGKDRIFK